MNEQELLQAVMTAAEAAEEFSLAPRTVQLDCVHNRIPNRKAKGTYLIPRAAAEAKWGYRKHGASRATATDAGQPGQ